eukprot:353976-Chlamydomonas_euryale.AAC.1
MRDWRLTQSRLCAQGSELAIVNSVRLMPKEEKELEQVNTDRGGLTGAGRQGNGDVHDKSEPHGLTYALACNVCSSVP